MDSKPQDPLRRPFERRRSVISKLVCGFGTIVTSLRMRSHLHSASGSFPALCNLRDNRRVLP